MRKALYITLFSMAISTSAFAGMGGTASDSQSGSAIAPSSTSSPTDYTDCPFHKTGRAFDMVGAYTPQMAQSNLNGYYDSNGVWQGIK